MHLQNQKRQERGRRQCLRQGLKRAVFPLLSAALLFAGLGKVSAGITGGWGQGSPAALKAPLPPGCVFLSAEQCESICGGDVRMVLNAARTKLTVNVIDNEYEARLGRIPPKEVYEIDVHNRVVDTDEAPFMPTAGSRRRTSGRSGLTTRPEQFPEGNWLITGVSPRQDKYGPYMIGTGAVGEVEVYESGPRGRRPIGRHKDTGYGVHASTVPFDASGTYGCIVASQESITKLAGTLQKDREENPDAVQTIRVSRRRRGK